MGKDDRYILCKDNACLFLIALGCVWATAAIVGETKYHFISILILLSGITLFKPIFQLIQRGFSLVSLSPDDPLKMLNKLLSIGIPIGLIVGFFPFKENINVFFPTFSILFGIIFGIIAYIYQIRLLGLTGILLILSGFYYGLVQTDHFSTAGFTTALLLAGSGIMVRFTKNKPSPKRI